ncbi:MAG: hypothetical protein M3R43_07970 [Acidobacteriota bacterium]|nr:hypothetical protein [Acidobacteriota bacterium]
MNEAGERSRDGLRNRRLVAATIVAAVGALTALGVCATPAGANDHGWDRCRQSMGLAPGCSSPRRNQTPSQVNARYQKLQTQLQQLDAEMQRRREEQKRNAADAQRRGQSAASRGDWADAANQFMAALTFAPGSPDIRAQLMHANNMIADQAAARDMDALRARIADAIAAADMAALNDAVAEQIANQKRAALVAYIKETKAEREARSSLISKESANCIFDGRGGCVPPQPVPLYPVTPGGVTVPADAAKFIEGIPKAQLVQPFVAREVALFARDAHYRGELEGVLTAAKAAANAHPDDPQATARVAVISGQVKAAKTDEDAQRKRVKKVILLPN